MKVKALPNLELDLHHTHNYGPFLGLCYLLDPACTSLIDTPTLHTHQLLYPAMNWSHSTYVFPLPALPWHSFWTPRHLKMKALCFFEKLGTNYPVTWNNILEKHSVLNGIFLKWSVDILIQKIYSVMQTKRYITITKTYH